MIVLPILTTRLKHFTLKGWKNVLYELGSKRVNPLTPKTDQRKISSAASPEIYITQYEELDFS